MHHRAYYGGRPPFYQPSHPRFRGRLVVGTNSGPRKTMCARAPVNVMIPSGVNSAMKPRLWLWFVENGQPRLRELGTIKWAFLLIHVRASWRIDSLGGQILKQLVHRTCLGGESMDAQTMCLPLSITASLSAHHSRGDAPSFHIRYTPQSSLL
jgi:hypothetical protein